MLKNITEKENAILSLLRDSEELTSTFNNLCMDEDTRKLVNKLTKDEVKFINSVTENLSLRQEIDNLGYNTILDYLEKKGFVNLFGLFNRLESILNNDYKNISKIEDIFTYIEFLLNGDMIIEATQGKKITDKAKASLLSLKREVFQEELKSLIKEIDDNKKENDILSRNKSALQSENNALSHSVEQLRCARSSLLNENASLKQQIDDNRILFKTGLNDEIKAERTRKLEELEKMIEETKKERENEFIKINSSINASKNELEELDKVFSRYSSDYPIYVDEESGKEEYDIVWEPIDEKHEIMNVKKKDLVVYYNSIKERYKIVTGRTDSEIECDFTSRYSSFNDFIRFVRETFIINGYSRILLINSEDITVKGIIDYCNEGLEKYGEFFNNDEYKRKYNLFKELEKIISLLKIPKYVKKEKRASYRDDINSLMLVIEAKKQISRAKADKLIAEEALSYALKTFLCYLPENTRIDYLTALDDGLSSKGKKLVRELTSK